LTASRVRYITSPSSWYPASADNGYCTKLPENYPIVLLGPKSMLIDGLEVRDGKGNDHHWVHSYRSDCRVLYVLNTSHGDAPKPIQMGGCSFRSYHFGRRRFSDLFESPVQFASSCLGYFIGVASYICYLWLRSVGIRTPDLSRPSRAAPKEIVSEVFKEATDWDVHSKCQPSEMTGAIAFGQLGQSTRG
jgi:hypothetical protein